MPENYGVIITKSAQNGGKPCDQVKNVWKMLEQEWILSIRMSILVVFDFVSKINGW